VRSESLPEDSAVLVQRGRVFISEVVEELRRALHIGEEKRDDTRG
jgi:hypothetical protein